MSNIGIIPEAFNPRVLYIYISKFNKKVELNLHFHDYFEMKYILSGSCEYFIDGKSYKVSEGDIIFCNPNVEHVKKIESCEYLTELNIGINNFKIDELKKGYILESNESPIIKLTKHKKDFHLYCLEILN
ncbi:MAG: AraC family ligand binding domain-containing protein, partial [Clostridiales bacterium]